MKQPLSPKWEPLPHFPTEKEWMAELEKELALHHPSTVVTAENLWRITLYIMQNLVRANMTAAPKAEEARDPKAKAERAFEEIQKTQALNKRLREKGITQDFTEINKEIRARHPELKTDFDKAYEEYYGKANTAERSESTERPPEKAEDTK